VRRLVQRLLIAVVVAIYVVLALVLIKSYFHEFLPTPAIADCRNGDAMALSVVSTRKHGVIVKRDFVSCAFYWHEATTEGK
jgi:uncharacterized membrane protein (DUF485 family)